MKKLSKVLAVTLAVITLLSVVAIPSSADAGDWSDGLPTYTYDALEYVLDDGEISITGYVGSPTEVIIPSKIDGFTVTYISSFAFEDCISLKTIIIPDTVKSIGMFAFRDCESLNNITITDSINRIGRGAFSGTAYLQDKSNWENGALYIGNYLVRTNSELSGAYTIKSGTISIADCAFTGCGDLTSISLPSSLRQIGCREALDFAGITFADLENLEVINVSANNKYYSSKDGVLFNKDISELIHYPSGKTETAYTIPNTVKTISEGAFNGCYGLNITIPASVSQVGWDAFNYVVIRGYTGTYAETYANENGIEFTSLGSIPTSKIGLYKVGDTWCYVKDGKVDYNFNNLAKYNGKWYYVEDGIKNASFTGLYKYSGKWYYVKSGVVNTSYTGLVKHTDGKYYYVKSGVKTSFNGLVKYNSKWYYVKNGVVDKTYTGLVKHTDGKYYYVKSGVKTSFNGLVKYNSKWYYVKNGVVDKSYTGLVKHTDGKWYHVKDGVKTTYTGLCKYSGKWYYVNKGVVDKSYTGYVTYNGKKYKVVKGIKV